MSVATTEKRVGGWPGKAGRIALKFRLTVALRTGAPVSGLMTRPSMEAWAGACAPTWIGIAASSAAATTMLRAFVIGDSTRQDGIPRRRMAIRAPARQGSVIASRLLHLRNLRFMPFRPLLLSLLLVPPAFVQTMGVPAKETLYYTVEWRLITAGKAKVQWVAGPREGSQLNLRVESVGLVSKLFKVEDNYSVNLNQGLCADSLQLTSHEGSRERETKISFDYAKRKADYLERDRIKNSVVLAKEIDIPACVHDIAGGLFFLRTLNLEPGQSAQIPLSDGKKSVMARVEAQQREDVKTPAGTFKAIRYEAYVFDNVLYRRSAHLNIWLSDDRRKLPVQIRVRMQFAIGTITLQLEKQE